MAKIFTHSLLFMRFSFKAIAYSVLFIITALLCVSLFALVTLQQHDPTYWANQSLNMLQTRTGLTQLSSQITDIGPAHMELRDIHLHDPDNFYIDRAYLRFYPTQVALEHTLHQLTLDQALLRIELKDDTINTGHLSQFIQSLTMQITQHTIISDDAQSSDILLPRNFPVNNLFIRASKLQLVVDGQDITIPFSLSLNANEEKLAGHITIGDTTLSLNQLYFHNIGELSLDTTLGGTIPFSWDGKSLLFTNGDIASTEPGQFNFRNQQTIPDPSMELLFNALSNFSYEFFTIGLSSQADKRLQASIAFEGKNIDLHGERDINLNVNIYVDLLKSLRSMMSAQTLSNNISEQLSTP